VCVVVKTTAHKPNPLMNTKMIIYLTFLLRILYACNIYIIIKDGGGGLAGAIPQILKNIR